MKKHILAAAVALLLAGSGAHAQIVSNGTFDTNAGWTEFTIEGSPNVFTFNYTGAAPSDTATGGPSTGGVLRIQGPGDLTHSGIYTPVTLTGGHTYELDGLARAVSHTAASNWLECFIVDTMPTNGSNPTANRVTQLNSWACLNFDDVFLSCETLTNGGNGQGRFTVPGSGSQQWYLVLKSGICCGGGPSELLVDTITLTDLGAGPTFDAPPTQLVETFDDGNDQNNYGGLYRAFAGGDPGGVFTAQDGSMAANSVDAQGTTGAAGDRALHVRATTPIGGQGFIYYGAVMSLSLTEAISQDLTSMDNLEFSIKRDGAAAPTDWAVRIEDGSGNPPQNFNYIDLEPELITAGTGYANFSIPLTDFVTNADGGTVAPNLTTARVITLVGKAPNVTNDNDPGIYIDNFRITGTGGPTFDAPPIPLTDNFDDNNSQNNYGGTYRAFGGGDPGGTFQAQDASMAATSVDAEGTTGAAGDYALRIYADTPLQGQSFIYYGGVLSLSPSESVGQDLTVFTALEFDMKTGAGSTEDWAIRIEDTTATPPQDFNYIDLEPLFAATSGDYSAVAIPLVSFVNAADGGTVAPDLSSAKMFTLVVKTTSLLVTEPDIYIDNLRLTGGPSNVAGWSEYE